MDDRTYDRPEPTAVREVEMAVVKMKRTGEVGVIIDLGDHELFVDIDTAIGMNRMLTEIIDLIMLATDRVNQPAGMVQ